MINSQAKEIECNVIEKTATITIPIKHLEKVTWFKKSTYDSSEEFACLVAINEFEFGFSIFKGSQDEKTGSIQELIKDGQSDLWTIDETGGEVLENYTFRVSYTPKEIKIIIPEGKTFELVFKDQPKTFFVHITGFKLTCKSRSNIINYKKKRPNN
jgi:hypothetical protein